MTKIAFLGLGRMGQPMASNLARAGYTLSVWNRSPEKAERFAAEHGARPRSTPAAAVAEAEVVITMLADDAALLDAVEGEEGVLGALPVGVSPLHPHRRQRRTRGLPRHPLHRGGRLNPDVHRTRPSRIPVLGARAGHQRSRRQRHGTADRPAGLPI